MHSWNAALLEILQNRPQIGNSLWGVINTMVTSGHTELVRKAQQIRELGGIVPPSMIDLINLPPSQPALGRVDLTQPRFLSEHGTKLATVFLSYSRFLARSVNPPDTCEFNQLSTEVEKATENIVRLRDGERLLRELQDRVRKVESFRHSLANAEANVAQQVATIERAGMGELFAVYGFSGLSYIPFSYRCRQ